MLTKTDIPYWRLSGFYFFYFSFLGAWVPFWNLYLENELHFDAEAIGIITSLLMATKIVAPYLWGWLADHFGRRMTIIRLGSLLACICFLGVFVSQDYYWLMTVVVIFSFFLNAVLSQFEVITLTHLKEHSHRYSQIRLWGSIGFIVAVFFLGIAFDYVSIKYLPYILTIFLVGVWLNSLCIQEVDDENVEHVLHQSEHSSFTLFKQQLKQPQVILFFVVCFLIQLSHGPYYTFYTIYLEDLGYQLGSIGGLWSLGVLAEVVLFMFMHRLLAAYTLKDLLIITLLMTAIRWFLIAFFAENFVMLLLAQLMHAASFGSYHAIAIEMVRGYFTGGSQGQGQAFYSAVSFGLGGALGALLSGYLWQFGVTQLFVFAGCSVTLGLLIVLVGMRDHSLEGV